MLLYIKAYRLTRNIGNAAKKSGKKTKLNKTQPNQIK